MVLEYQELDVMGLQKTPDAPAYPRIKVFALFIIEQFHQIYARQWLVASSSEANRAGPRLCQVFDVGKNCPVATAAWR